MVFKRLDQMENSSINYNYFEIRYAITNLIKDKKHKMVKYILNKYEFNNIDRIFGFLCYLGDIELKINSQKIYLLMIKMILKIILK